MKHRNVRTALIAVGKAEQWDQVPTGTLRTLKDAIEAEAALRTAVDLDVQRLAAAIFNESGLSSAWCRNDATTAEFAERLAAEYARLQEQDR